MSEETPEAKHSPATEQKNEIPQNIIPAHLVTANANANAAPSANSESAAKRMLADKWSVKIFVIILALLAFQLPLYMVRYLTQERKTQAEDEAEASRLRAYALRRGRLPPTPFVGAPLSFVC